MSTQKIKRRMINFSIERPLQIRLVTKILMIAFLSILIIGGGFYFYTDQKIGDTYKMAHIKMDTFRALLFPAILIFVAIAAFLTTLFTLFFPGKIAGPLYRTKREMKRVGDGDFKTTLDFRNGDELKDLAMAFNIMVENLNSKLWPIRQYLGEIILNYEELCRLAEEGEFSALKGNLRIQIEKGKQLRTLLDQIKWKDEGT